MYEEEKEKLVKADLNNGIFRNSKRLVEETNRAMEDLSGIQREFCHAMMSASSAKAAAITAGYSPKSAQSKSSQLLANPAVQRYISYLGILRSQASALDGQEIISMQLKLYYECVESGDRKEANKALDQLARMNGLYNTGRPTINPKEINTLQGEDKKSKEVEMIDFLTEVNNRS